MLGLATHEPHFRVLREDVFFQESKARTCRLCGQTGHKAEECRGQAKEKSGEFDEKTQGNIFEAIHLAQRIYPSRVSCCGVARASTTLSL